MHPFCAALQARDLDAALALLSDDVVFRSPVVFKPYQGREAAAMILDGVSHVLKDFRYLRDIGAEDAADQAMVFSARVGDREIEGCDFLHIDDEGLVDELMVMVRPLSGALALAEAMKAQFALAESRAHT